MPTYVETELFRDRAAPDIERASAAYIVARDAAKLLNAPPVVVRWFSKASDGGTSGDREIKTADGLRLRIFGTDEDIAGEYVTATSTIFIRSDLSLADIIHCVAHEVKHHDLRWGMPGKASSAEEEAECNRFAATVCLKYGHQNECRFCSAAAK